MARIEIPEGKGDPEVRMWKLRPEMGIGAGALSHAIYEQSILPVRERELARMRIAQINDCAICQQWRKTRGHGRGADRRRLRARRRLADVPGLLRAGTAGRRVRRAFRARPPRHRRRRSSRGCAREYTDAEILDLTVCIGAWLALGRTMNVLGVDSYCRIAP